MRLSIVRSARRIGIMLSLSATLVGTIGQSAEAMSPAQTTANGVVTLLGNNNVGSIERFWSTTLNGWGYGYTHPTVYYYGGTYGNYETGCSNTSYYPNNGFYCGRDHHIYLDYPYMQRLVNNYGDFGTGGFLAHEWGHAVARMLGYRFSGYQNEYFADCLAGMYTRFGYNTGRLTGGDFWEFHAWLAGQPTSVSHGTGASRAAWFKYGYQSYNINNCALVANA